MPDSEIRAVFWDFGGVVTSSPFEAFNVYESEAGVPRDTIRTINATDPDTNAWARLERSEVGLDEFAELFEAEARAAGFDLDGHRVLACLSGDVRPEMVEALRRCRERLICACLTNNVRSGTGPGMATTELRAAAVGEAMDLFHHVIESSVVGVRKPEPEFYRLALEAAGVEAPEVVYLDDLGINLKPAKAMGMTTIKVLNASQALHDLEQAVGFPLT